MKRHWTALTVLSLMTLVATIFILYLGMNIKDDVQTQTSATTKMESILVARLTMEPNLETTMTPYYGEVLYDEAIRQMTITPTLANPAPQCWLVADYWKLDELETYFQISVGPLREVEAFVAVVWNAETCGAYLPVKNTIRFWLNDNENGIPISEDMIDLIIDTVDQGLNMSEDITPLDSNIVLEIYFGRDHIAANWSAINELRHKSLSGLELWDALTELESE